MASTPHIETPQASVEPTSATPTAAKRRFGNLRFPWQTTLMVTALTAFAFFVLMPLSGELFVKAPDDHMIGDGSDPRGLLWCYRILNLTLREHPTRYIFGAIYTELGSAPSGQLLWIPWCERILVPLLTPFTKDSTIATAVAWALLTANGLAMIWMARIFRWSHWVTFAAAIAFAVTPFTRGRVSVHMALAGVYFLPLIVGGLERAARWKPTDQNARKTIGVVALAFFGACTAAHYHLVITTLLVPFFTVFFIVRARRTESHLFLRRCGVLLAAAALPTAFLAFQFACPAPPALRAKIVAYPESAPDVQKQYLEDVGAHPIDYVAGDVKFGELDILPQRQKINHEVLTHLDRSHPQERANGIRWSMLAVAAAALVFRILRPKQAQNGPHIARSDATSLWLGLALFAFLFSLSPRGLVMYGEEYGASQWANRLIPNFRVPSRFGPVVNFAVIAIAAEFVTELSHFRKRLPTVIAYALGAALAAASIVEFIPKSTMVASPIRIKTLTPHPNGECGQGVFLPFSLWDYWAFEETRGTKCALLNPATEAGANVLEGHIGNRIFATPAEQDSLVKFAQCSGLDWLHFRPEVPEPARVAMCEKLGWEMLNVAQCRAPNVSPVKRDWRECLVP